MNTRVSRATPVLMLVGFAALLRLAAQPVDSSAEAALRATMAERHKASLEGDTQNIAASMTDDYLQTDISGVVQDKETWLKNYFIPLAVLIKAGKHRSGALPPCALPPPPP